MKEPSKKSLEVADGILEGIQGTTSCACIHDGWGMFADFIARAFDEYEAKLKIATEALEFYSNENLWNPNEALPGTGFVQKPIEKTIYIELGKRARQALIDIKALKQQT